MTERSSIQITLPPPPGEVSHDDHDAPRVDVLRSNGRATHSTAGLVCWLVAGVTLLGVGLLSLPVSGNAIPLPSVLALVLGPSFLIHGLIGRPLTRLLHEVRDESARLREAMTCPYCRDRLDRQALLCGRPGCGAIYHAECWEECKAGYGGCAIYGCGHTTGKAVGRFALQRRLLRLVVATVLFPPLAVTKLRELESQSFKDVWAAARAHQLEISNNETRTLLYGLLNAIAVGAISLALILWAEQADGWGSTGNSERLLYLLPVFVLPFVFLRMPLLRAFVWGSGRVVARVFQTELAALGRADAGTVLGRLVAGIGKTK